MKKIDIIRAWKDDSYRNSLSAEQITQLPTNPAGNLSEDEQNMVTGGGHPVSTNPDQKTCGINDRCEER
ncbi:MAG: mersacidin/lichenicidin family type 2 lantibiotic [Alteromonadaceae bacterium]|nr:mersacidin/lichenicidin family type 2 lantibiotic [Alteromonadaceae bacterium]